MSKDQVVAGLIDGEDICKLREAVCVQVEKVYDHCRDKDCVEDAVVDFVEDVGCYIDKAVKVKVKDAEVVKVLADLDEVPFKRGFFTVNVRFKIKLKIEFCYRDQYGHLVSSDPKVGFVWFSKTVILFGSEGQVKIFTASDTDSCSSGNECEACGALMQQDNKPNVTVEVAEPLVLNARVKRIRCHHVSPFGLTDEDELETAADANTFMPSRRVVVTIGIFSIIKLTRLVQLLIPAFNFCFPTQECISSTDENPCELFETIDFPFDQFFPPQIFDFPVESEDEERKREIRCRDDNRKK